MSSCPECAVLLKSNQQVSQVITGLAALMKEYTMAHELEAVQSTMRRHGRALRRLEEISQRACAHVELAHG
jgi:hypothetical protein